MGARRLSQGAEVTPSMRPMAAFLSGNPADLRAAQGAQQRAQVFQAPGDQVLHALGRFQPALDLQQARLQQHPPLAVTDVTPDHHVEQAVFVLKGRRRLDAAAFRRGRVTRRSQPRTARHAAGAATGANAAACASCLRSIDKGCFPRLSPRLP